jgi:hypothetical protein
MQLNCGSTHQDSVLKGSLTECGGSQKLPFYRSDARLAGATK